MELDGKEIMEKKEYFILQIKMISRKLREQGIHPALGIVLAIVSFVLASDFIFSQTEFAKYIVILTALSLLAKVSEIKRNDFLKIVFGNKRSRQIRVVENVLISMPFIILLLFHLAYLESMALIAVSIILAFYTFKNTNNYSLPTPFSKKPFEFTVGFRNTFLIFPLAYILTIIAISINNLNLGIFAMLLIFLISVSYYIKPENEYFVWSYSVSPSKFIFQKIKTASLYCTFLVSPIILCLIGFYPQNAILTLLFTGLGFVFLWTTILIKYSAYPREMNLSEGILIALCVNFPPLLLALIPFFYFKAINKLKVLLK
jgi:hypothetical protein